MFPPASKNPEAIRHLVLWGYLTPKERDEYEGANTERKKEIEALASKRSEFIATNLENYKKAGKGFSVLVGDARRQNA